VAKISNFVFTPKKFLKTFFKVTSYKVTTTTAQFTFYQFTANSILQLQKL